MSDKKHNTLSQMSLSSVSFKLYEASIIFAFLKSLNAWFTWNISDITFGLICIFLQAPFLLLCFGLLQLTSVRAIVSAILLAAFYLHTLISPTTNELIGKFIYYLPIFSLIFLPATDLDKLLRLITKVFAIILTPALLFWIGIQSGIPIPAFGGHISFQDFNAYQYANHLFCLHSTTIYDDRFTAVFLEPGHLGMACAFLLMGNKFNLKSRECMVIAAALIASFSLAGYILAACGFVLSAISSGKRIIHPLLAAVLCTVASWSFFSSYNDGDNPINNLILSRLQIKDGEVSGNNRFTPEVESFFENAMASGEIWNGIGMKKFLSMELPSAGYKVFLIQFGIIGVILIFAFYATASLMASRRYAIAILAMYGISFLQRGYPHYHFEIILFMVSIGSNHAQTATLAQDGVQDG